MRILSLYYTHKPGGFCKRLYRLLNVLSKDGHEVHYLTLDTPPANLSSDIQLSYIPFPFTKRKGLLFWALFTLWCPIFVFYKTLCLRPKHFVVFGAYYSAMLFVTRLIYRKPLTLFLRSLVFKIDVITGKSFYLRYLANIVEKIGMKSATTIVCMTMSMKRELETFLNTELANVKVLPNDIPSLKVNEDLKDLDQETFLVFTSGVIDARKNIDLLLNAFNLLKEHYPPPKLLLYIAGTGPLISHYQEQCNKLSLDNVIFLNWVDDLAPYYKRANLALHPSFHEGMPNSVLEALALDKTVLVSNSAELKELMKYEELIFDPNDAQALAAKLEKIIQEPSYQESLNRLCLKRKVCFKFDWDRKAIECIL